MKIQAIELRERGRVDLGANAPLPKPLALYVEPTSLCNMRWHVLSDGRSEAEENKAERVHGDGGL